MENKKTYIAMFLFFEIMFLTLLFVLSIHWIISMVISTIILWSISYLDAEYYFLPTNYRKRMKDLDWEIGELDRQLEELNE